MISFILTVTFLISVWTFIMIDALPLLGEQPGLFFVVAVWLIIYFIGPLVSTRWLCPLLLIISYTIIHLFFLSPESLYPWAMYHFFILDVAMREEGGKTTSQYEYLFVIAFSIIPFFLQTPSYSLWFHLLMIAVMVTLALSITKLKDTNDKLEKRRTAFLVEYRALKRHAHQSEQNARAEERTRIARDMHDSVGHQLTALMMQLEMTERKAEGETKSFIIQAKLMARDSLNETRKAVRALSGKTYGISAVLQLIRKLEVESHIRVQLTTREGALSAPLTNEQYVIVYRFVQEGITNVMRHSRSREVAVTLEVLANASYQMSIANRIHTVAPAEKGFGLTSLSERLEALNGRLDMVRTDTHFCITGIFPLKGET